MLKEQIALQVLRQIAVGVYNSEAVAVLRVLQNECLQKLTLSFDMRLNQAENLYFVLATAGLITIVALTILVVILLEKRHKFPDNISNNPVQPIQNPPPAQSIQPTGV